MREDFLEKLKAIAWGDSKEIREVVDEAFSSYLKGKTVKAKPKEGSK
jgi:phosphotransferase system IIA component